jgi:phage baseplate assembly protein W
MATRSTRQFTDLDLNFGYNPRTRDIATKTDDNAIRNALRNLIYTNHYERPFQPDLGSQLQSMLFEQLDDFSLSVAERVLYNTFTKYEPRIEVQRVQVAPNPNDNNEVFIAVEYKIRNTQTVTEFTTTFSRVR